MKFALLAAALLATPFAAQAQALASDQPTAVAVTARDLDLNNPSDANRMLGRLGDAALEACGASPFSLPQYRDAVRRSDCYRNGVDQAVASLDAPALSDAYHHHSYVQVGAAGQHGATGE